MKIKAKKLSAVILSLLTALSCTGGIGISAENTSKEAVAVNKSAGAPSESEKDVARESFVSSQLEFSLNMFKKSFAQSNGENMLISPLSAVPALAMAANGADNATLSEMEKTLGGDMSIDELNEQLSEYLSELYSGEKCRLHMANSVWIKDADNLVVMLDFLRTNKKYYSAEIFKTPFNQAAVEKINGWVSDNTDGMIKKIINSIDKDSVMYLINALAFDAEWNRPYTSYDISDGTFTAADGVRQNTEMMYSGERVYLSDGKAAGFMKPYKGGKYSFAAILPDKNLTLEEYVDSLTAEGLQKLLANGESVLVETKIPKFQYDYDISLNEVLKEMGISSAFEAEKADFSKMGKIKDGNLYISDVIQKTFIAVDENGTKAGAATAVIMADGITAVPAVKKQVYLDRPFIYMIVDNKSRLPIFMGCLENLT